MRDNSAMYDNSTSDTVTSNIVFDDEEIPGNVPRDFRFDLSFYDTDNSSDNMSRELAGEQHLLHSQELQSESEQKASSERDNTSDQLEEYGDLRSFVAEYPLREGGIREDGRLLIFDFDETEQGRRCRFTNTVHTQNNGYLLYNKDRGVLELRCRNKECANYRELIWKKTASTSLSLPTESSDEVESYWISVSDDALAIEFKRIYGEAWCSTFADEKFSFKSHIGLYWEPDSGQSKLRMLLANGFKHHLICRLESAVDNQLITDKQFKSNLKAIKQKLETFSRKMGIIKTLGDYLMTTNGLTLTRICLSPRMEYTTSTRVMNAMPLVGQNHRSSSQQINMRILYMFRKKNVKRTLLC